MRCVPSSLPFAPSAFVSTSVCDRSLFSTTKSEVKLFLRIKAVRPLHIIAHPSNLPLFVLPLPSPRRLNRACLSGLLEQFILADVEPVPSRYLYLPSPTNPLQESHRVKLLVGAIEMALEQETILAIARVVSTFSENLSPSSPPPPPLPSSSSSSPPPLPAIPGGDSPAASGGAGLSPPVVPLPPATAGGGSTGSGDMSMPMLPPGVSVSVVVDLAAMSVALAEGGANVAAVALSAAHCKVNVST